MAQGNDILISIRPKWCELIFSGEKTCEIRKTKPKLLPGCPVAVYIWQTEGGGIVGTFRLKEFRFIQAWKDRDGEKHLGNTLGLRHCVNDLELFNYLYKESKPHEPYPGGWAWLIENPVRFDEPISLDRFSLKRPPQSWQYIRHMPHEFLQKGDSTDAGKMGIKTVSITSA